MAAQEPVSPQRRGGRGVRRASLTKAEVVNAAFDLLGETGLEQLSMHRLARHLGVGSMTLYSYVSNKQELIDALADRVRADAFTSLPLPSTSIDWREQLIEHFLHVRGLVVANPGFAQLLLHSGRIVASESGGHSLRVMDALLQSMIGAGFSAETAGRVFSACQQYTMGFALRESAWTHSDQTVRQDQQRWRETLHELSASDFPALHAARAAFLASGSDEQFVYGLRCLIEGPPMAREP